MKREEGRIRRHILPITVSVLAAIGGTTFALMDDNSEVPNRPEHSRTTLLKGLTALDPWEPTTVPATIYEAPTDSRPSAIPSTSVQQMPDNPERILDPAKILFDDKFVECMDINNGYPKKDFTPPPTTLVTEDGWDESDLEEVTPTTVYPRADKDIRELCSVFATFKVVEANGESKIFIEEAPAATPIPAPYGKVTG